MTTTFESVEDILASVGRDLGTSRWFELDRGRVAIFADTTEDRQWIPVDPERAATGPFGGPIAHGFLILSLAAAVFEDVMEMPWASTVVNYGLDKVRFPSPAPVGCRIHATGHLADATAIDGGVQMVVRVQFVREEGGKPVCVADAVIRVLA